MPCQQGRCPACCCLLLELELHLCGAAPTVPAGLPRSAATTITTPLQEATALSLARDGVGLCGREWTITARVKSSTGRWSEQAERTFRAPECCQPHGAVESDARRCCSRHLEGAVCSVE